MPTFDSNGLALAYETAGHGRPILLIHGFASSRRDNWKQPGWFEALVAAGRRVVAFDCRGHGESAKPHEPEAYDVRCLVGDAIQLLDHLGLPRVELMGYSMGARISAALLVRHPERFSAAVLAGVGASLLGVRAASEGIARALEAPDAAAVRDPTARAFRAFAERRGNDLRALAACMRGLRRTVDVAELERLRVPVLVVAGDQDELVGDPRRLAAHIPGSELALVPGRDHLTTVGDPRYKAAVLRFLDAQRSDEAAGGSPRRSGA